MCLIWGLTWIAIKTGVTALPPFLFASLRFLAAGSLLLLLSRRRGGSPPPSSYWPRIVFAALLVNTACYGFLFWGMQHVSSAVSAVVNLALIPVGLFAIGLASREESFSMRKLVSIGVGVLGLAILFLPKLSVQEEAPTLAGMAALVAGTLAYCWGSVLSRPLLKKSRQPRPIDTLTLSGLHSLIGGIALAALAFAFEPVTSTMLSRFLTPAVFASWLFLVLGGSVIAFTIYLGLLRDWEPSRAGLYAFVSPVIAVAVGVGVFGESFGLFETTGSLIMLGAAALVLSPR
jgi:drug/metabolite transporter (DMT)-like permease